MRKPLTLSLAFLFLFSGLALAQPAVSTDEVAQANPSLSPEEIEAENARIADVLRAADAYIQLGGKAGIVDETAEEVEGEMAPIEEVEETEEQNEARLAFLDAAATLRTETLDVLASRVDEAEVELSDPATVKDLIEGNAESIRKQHTIYEITQTLADLQERITEKQERRARVSAEAAEALTAEITELNERFGTLSRDFAILVGGIPENVLEDADDAELDWEKELQDIFTPLLSELREFTDRPRKIERFRREIASLDKSLEAIDNAVIRIDALLEDISNEDVRTRLLASKDIRVEQRKDLATRREALQGQLTQMLDEQVSFVEGSRTAFIEFVQTRGLNLVLMGLAFLVVFLVFRFLLFLVRATKIFHGRTDRQFWANLIDVIFLTVGVVSGVLAGLAVLMIRSDWVILAIVIVIFLTSVWALKDAIPAYFEQIKLLLNVGTVRIGERVVYEGLPYRVESISAYSWLVNPELTGGRRRLELRQLIGMNSRPCREDEIWFPSKEGDWVLINGPKHRQVIQQTPEIVDLSWYGMRETMPASAFYNSNISNVSQHPFWAGITLRIAFKHRYIDIASAAKALQDEAEKSIKERPYGDKLLVPWVDYMNIGEDGLQFMVWVLIDKGAGDKHPDSHLTLNKACLKVANEHRWEITRVSHVELSQNDSPEPSGKPGTPKLSGKS